MRVKRWSSVTHNRIKNIEIKEENSMNEIIKKLEAEQMKAEAPEFNTGDTVRVYAKVKEGNRERIQVFEGTVLKPAGRKQPRYIYCKKTFKWCWC